MQSLKEATKSEITERLNRSGFAFVEEQIHKRISDLVKENKLEDSGKTRPGKSGRNQTIWKIKK